MNISRLPVLAPALLACALGSLTPAALAAVTVTNAWVRGTVAAQDVSGAYFTLQSDRPATLVAAASPVAKRVELHEMSMANGVMRMRAVNTLALPAGKPVELSPGGYHLMLMNLSHPLKDGDKVPFVLTVRDDAGKESRVAVEAVVRPLGAPPPVHSGSHGH